MLLQKHPRKLIILRNTYWTFIVEGQQLKKKDDVLVNDNCQKECNIDVDYEGMNILKSDFDILSCGKIINKRIKLFH